MRHWIGKSELYFTIFPCEKAPPFKCPEIAPNQVQGKELLYKFASSYYDNTSTGHQIIVFIKIYYYTIGFSNIQE